MSGLVDGQFLLDFFPFDTRTITALQRGGIARLRRERSFDYFVGAFNGRVWHYIFTPNAGATRLDLPDHLRLPCKAIPLGSPLSRCCRCGQDAPVL